MFSCSKEAFGNHLLYRCIDSDSGMEMHLVPELGGIINGLFLNRKDEKIPLLDYYDSAETYWAEIDGRFVNAVLAPYPNRLSGGSYSFHGQSYQFDELFDGEPNSIHGILLKQPFIVNELDTDEDKVRFVQSCNYKGDNPGYPFPFYLEQEIVLDSFNLDLTCTTLIKNTGTLPSPMCFGQHIYLNTGTKIDEMEVEFPGTEVLKLDNSNIPIGERKPLPMNSNNGKLRDTQLDNTLVVGSGNETSNNENADVRMYDPQKEIELTLSINKEEFGYLQLYTPPDRHAIGTEPMSCAPDAFNNGMGLKELAAGESWNSQWQIQIN